MAAGQGDDDGGEKTSRSRRRRRDPPPATVPDTCTLAYSWIGSTTSILGTCENACFCWRSSGGDVVSGVRRRKLLMFFKLYANEFMATWLLICWVEHLFICVFLFEKIA